MTKWSVCGGASCHCRAEEREGLLGLLVPLSAEPAPRVGCGAGCPVLEQCGLQAWLPPRVPAGQEVLSSPRPSRPTVVWCGCSCLLSLAPWPGPGLSLPSSQPPWAARAGPPFRLRGLPPCSAVAAGPSSSPPRSGMIMACLPPHLPLGLSWAHLNERSASGTGSAVSSGGGSGGPRRLLPTPGCAPSLPAWACFQAPDPLYPAQLDSLLPSFLLSFSPSEAAPAPSFLGYGFLYIGFVA